MNQKILIKFPTRSRPKKFLQTLEKYISMADDIKNIFFLVSIDEDDLSMDNDDMLDFLHTIDNVYICNLYRSTSKVNAINREIEFYAHIGWEILLLASDDMIPQVQGYDNIIRRDMKRLFPDTNGCLWYYDGYQNKTCTLSVIGRERYDKLGYIYHPSYRSESCDVEHTEVSLRDGIMSPILPCIIKHEHFHNLKDSNKDELFHRNRQFIKQDKQNLIQRRLNNFPI